MIVRILDRVDQQTEHFLGNPLGILAVGGQAGSDHLAQHDAVETDQADILRDFDPLGIQQPERSEAAVIIRTKHTGGLFLLLQQSLNKFNTIGGIMERIGEKFGLLTEFRENGIC